MPALATTSTEPGPSNHPRFFNTPAASPGLFRRLAWAAEKLTATAAPPAQVPGAETSIPRSASPGVPRRLSRDTRLRTPPYQASRGCSRSKHSVEARQGRSGWSVAGRAPGLRHTHSLTQHAGGGRLARSVCRCAMHVEWIPSRLCSLLTACSGQVADGLARRSRCDATQSLQGAGLGARVRAGTRTGEAAAAAFATVSKPCMASSHSRATLSETLAGRQSHLCCLSYLIVDTTWAENKRERENPHRTRSQSRRFMSEERNLNFFAGQLPEQRL